MLMAVASPHPIKLAAALLLTLALTACGPDAPTPQDTTSEANSDAVRQASSQAAIQLDEILDGFAERTPALRPVATSTSDTCLAGETDPLWPHDPYRLRCSRSEGRYFTVRGELSGVLRQLDAAAQQAGLMTDSGETLQDVEASLAANGRPGDGRLLSPPTWTYHAPGHDGRIYVSWSQANFSRPSQHPVERHWPMVFLDDHPVDVDALWEGPLRGQQYLISIASSVTYHEVPWPS
ncbi:hypothetical protein MRQ36_00300 [Micromonospora sp. R77]|uniref:hypothetical protein n=1 Tax=Micromonospora sp. R77 TaxID=2925836 RepID=UPI001F60A4FF|nr:hypothetical protein [Micromonospora sp. R77]MCI4061091.1 hypothetical protein [Micromonospora sp. R77]